MVLIIFLEKCGFKTTRKIFGSLSTTYNGLFQKLKPHARPRQAPPPYNISDFDPLRCIVFDKREMTEPGPGPLNQSPDPGPNRVKKLKASMTFQRNVLS